MARIRRDDFEKKLNFLVYKLNENAILINNFFVIITLYSAC